VSPPDREGYVSLGTTGDLTLPAIKDVLARGGRIIAEENPNVPFTSGANRIHQSRLAAIVQSNELLPVLGMMPPNSAEQALARNVARLIPGRRRCTLQIGIGGALAGIGEALRNKRLRVWSEMGGDWLLDVMRGPRPAAREAVVSFLHGSSELYQFADKNPAICVDSCSVVNDPETVARQKRIVAINTVLEVDLSGNGNAEQIGERVISAPGGQPDFMTGASLARDGRAVLALRSINKYGGSCIVPELSGPLVTTPAQHVDHVVTEWGATRRLRDLASDRRVYEIIRVAHPLHRKQLAERARAGQLITEQQAGKLVRSVFPSILAADPELRRSVADQARQAELITGEQYEQAVRDLPPVAAAPPAGL